MRPFALDSVFPHDGARLDAVKLKLLLKPLSKTRFACSGMP
jgi:hypothetical protein